ncbi:hypothetical protein [Mitsuokella multacida]|uniref:hypothetical protein n=1 Tax=Mitsuokella multacida TaxID=52226 RepID=UPI003F5EA76E
MKMKMVLHIYDKGKSKYVRWDLAHLPAERNGIVKIRRAWRIMGAKVKVCKEG